VTTAGYAMALYWPWLNQIYEAYRVRCGKAASVGDLVFSQMKSAAASTRTSASSRGAGARLTSERQVPKL
jgi:hypothetical protein